MFIFFQKGNGVKQKAIKNVNHQIAQFGSYLSLLLQKDKKQQ